jgi:hypothetical protein
MGLEQPDGLLAASGIGLYPVFSVGLDHGFEAQAQQVVVFDQKDSRLHALASLFCIFCHASAGNSSIPVSYCLVHVPLEIDRATLEDVTGRDPAV